MKGNTLIEYKIRINCRAKYICYEINKTLKFCCYTVFHVFHILQTTSSFMNYII